MRKTCVTVCVMMVVVMLLMFFAPSVVYADDYRDMLYDVTTERSPYDVNKMLAYATSWVGKIEYGSSQNNTDPNNERMEELHEGGKTDCSWFVYHVLYRYGLLEDFVHSYEWGNDPSCYPGAYNIGNDISQAVPGDVICTGEGTKSQNSHVMLYLGGGAVVECAAGKGVVISDAPSSIREIVHFSCIPKAPDVLVSDESVENFGTEDFDGVEIVEDSEEVEKIDDGGIHYRAPEVEEYVVEDADTFTTETQASIFADISEAEAVEIIGPMATADMKKSGILASITAAQFILESGYGKSGLAQEANNCFGMKASLSGNQWYSAWDGVSIVTRETGEQNPDGSYVTITADFRAYPCIEKSFEDHSAYLTHAMNGDHLRYPNIVGEKDYRTAIQIIKDGGYATSHTYVEKICNIIEHWDLTRFDVVA